MAEAKKAQKDDKPPRDDKPRELKAAAAKDLEADETDAEAGGEAVEENPRRLTPKKIVLFIVLPLLLIIGGGSAAYFTGLLDKVLPGQHLSCEGVKEGDEDFAACSALQRAGNAAIPGAFIEIPNIIVNLNSSTKQPRFLKVSIKIELDSEAEKIKFEPLLPRVVDQFQMYLRELRVEDLQGTSGIYRMKIELLSRVRAAAPSIKVRDVLFQEILVQ